MVVFLKRKKTGFLLLYALFLLLLIETTSRTFWTIKRGVNFFNLKDIIYVYYPEVREVKHKQFPPADGCFDILFLGGSVLQNSQITHILLEKLTAKTTGKISVHNLAKFAHASLDSYYKYKELLDKNFDLVVFYHGINEVRANNYPSLLFKSDYSHYSWYGDINALENHPEINLVTLPYSVDFIWLRVKQLFGFLLFGCLERITGYTSTQKLIHYGQDIFLEYGENIKTADSFRNNLTNILELANHKREKVLLMTFAFYVPEDYSLAKFQNISLDYGSHKHAIEIWGKPENVIAGISAHNAVIEQVAKDYSNIIFIDQNKLIPKQGKYFNDICHFTREGCEKFVDNILEALVVEKGGLAL